MIEAVVYITYATGHRVVLEVLPFPMGVDVEEARRLVAQWHPDVAAEDVEYREVEG